MLDALRKRLRDDAGLAALQANRVDWETRPQGAALPGTVLSVISDPVAQNYRGPQALQRTLVQADLYAASAKELAALESAFVAAILPAMQVDGVKFARAFIIDRRTRSRDGKPDFVHCRQIDFYVWHRPTAI